jgi:integrase
MEAARKSSRYGHRDATMILTAYRHGLRASEVCDLQWHQVEINSGRLHVRRTKRGTPSVHPIQGDELRALRRLQREQPPGPYVFASERSTLFAVSSLVNLTAAAMRVRRARLQSRQRGRPNLIAPLVLLTATFLASAFAASAASP